MHQHNSNKTLYISVDFITAEDTTATDVFVPKTFEEEEQPWKMVLQFFKLKRVPSISLLNTGSLPLYIRTLASLKCEAEI